MKYTRKQYLNGECTHREYYGQFVTEMTKETVLNHIGLDAILASTDDAMNDIELSTWDMMRELPKTTFDHLKRLGDSMSLSGKVCIYKEAAKQIKDGDFRVMMLKMGYTESDIRDAFLRGKYAGI